MVGTKHTGCMQHFYKRAFHSRGFAKGGRQTDEHNVKDCILAIWNVMYKLGFKVTLLTLLNSVH